jgi:hypothetical protein
VGDQRGGGQRRAGRTKNGWLDPPSMHGRWIINSIGRVTDPDTDVTLVVLSRGHSSWASGTAAVARIAALTRRYLAW